MKLVHIIILGLIGIIIGLAWFNIKMKQEIQLRSETPAPIIIEKVPPVPEESNSEMPPPPIASDPLPPKPEGNDVGMEYPETDIDTGDTFPVACTMDAKICPDGTGVGRVGPNCEFAPCP